MQIIRPVNINRTKFTVVYWQLDILGRGLKFQQEITIMNRTVNCVTLISVCWQTWRDIREETSVAVDKGCHVVGLRKQHLGYHNRWDCWYFTLLYGLGYCTVLMLAVLTDGRWKLAATYCNTIRCHHCGMMLQTDPGRSTPCRMPNSSTANITVTVDSKCLHYMTLHRKIQQFVYCR